MSSIITLLYLLLFLAVLVAVYLLIGEVKDVLKSPAAKKAADWVEGTAQSGYDLFHAGVTGDLPSTPGPNQDDPAVNYFASVHDLVAHPVDSLKVLFSWD